MRYYFLQKQCKTSVMTLPWWTRRKLNKKIARDHPFIPVRIATCQYISFLCTWKSSAITLPKLKLVTNPLRYFLNFFQINQENLPLHYASYNMCATCVFWHIKLCSYSFTIRFKIIVTHTIFAYFILRVYK